MRLQRVLLPMQVPVDGADPLHAVGAALPPQVSFRNRVLILFDWLKTRVFGRDISLF